MTKPTKHLGIGLNLKKPLDMEVSKILDNVPPYMSKTTYAKKALLAYAKEQESLHDEDKIVEKVIAKLKLNGISIISEGADTIESPKKEKKSVSKRSKKDVREQEEASPAETPVDSAAARDDDEMVSNLDPNADLDAEKMEKLLDFLNG